MQMISIGMFFLFFFQFSVAGIARFSPPVGFASVGSARLLNIYPFNITHKSQH